MGVMIMSSGFIGRQEELALLHRAFSDSVSGLIPIYGRRRVGKSELILRFLRDHEGIYFLGKQAPQALQLREFLEEAAAATGEPLLATLPADGWKRALTAVTERWRKPARLVLVFDEFQWTVEASPELPSVIQELWDRSWSRSGNVLLILCGSYVGFMEREVLGRKSPLFGRRTAQILLRAFDYRTAVAFHPRWGHEEQARAYFICGGVPLYQKSFGAGKSVEANIVSQILDEYSALRREPEFLLHEELREVDNYYAILVALAAGHSTNRAISAATGIEERSLHYYLQQLMELGYLRRRYPLTGTRPVTRHVRYALDDPLLRFWFRFVFPNTSYIAQRGPERAFRDRIRPHLDAYFGACFERLCREAMPFIYAAEGVTAGFEVGEYWDRGAQIDIVSLREDGWTDIGECKWGSIQAGRSPQAEFDRRVAAYPNSRGATICRRIFTRQPVDPARRKDTATRWHSLADLYERGG